MEREVELYKNERELIFSESSLDERLSLSLEQRHRAYEEYVLLFFITIFIKTI